MASVDIYKRYFMFSRQHLEEQKKMASKITIDPSGVVGKVIVNGIMKQYTDIVSDPKTYNYSDATVVIVGDMRTIKYTPPSV